MPIAFRHDATSGVSVSVWDGFVSPDEVRDHMTTLACDANWGSGGLLLTDLSTVSAASRPEPIQLLAAASTFLDNLAQHAPDAKWAIVADRLFEQANRFTAYIEDEMRRVIVFNEPATACIWLGADRNHITAIIDALRGDLRATPKSASR